MSKKHIRIVVDPDDDEFHTTINKYKTLIYTQRLDVENELFVEVLEELERLYARNDYLEALCEAKGIPKGEYMYGPNPLQQDTDI